jgi:ParB-like chromosome segregation protein Spo0J
MVAVESLDLRFGRLRLAEPKALGRLRESVRRDGVTNPVVVSDAVEEGKLVVVDGFKRIRVVQERGEKNILVRTVALDLAGAHGAILAYNRPARGLTALEEGWVIQSLHRGHHLPQVKIAALLGRHKSWVCRRLRMVEGLAEELLEDVRLGLLSTLHVRYLCGLPRGNQNLAREAVQKHGLSSRQTALLVGKMRCCTDPEARRELLADPHKYLVKEDAGAPVRPRDPRLSEGANLLRDALLDLQAKAFRLLLACRDPLPARLSDDEILILEPAVEGASLNVRMALEALWPLYTRRCRLERETQAAAVRGHVPAETGGVEAGDRAESGDRRQDGQEAAQGSGGEAGIGGDGARTGGPQKSDPEGVETRRPRPAD